MAVSKCILWFALGRLFPVVFTTFLQPGDEEVENFNAIKSATINEVLLKELSANRCKFHLRQKNLRNLYFHLNDSGKSLYVENSRIARTKCLETKNATIDVFASRMDLSLSFPTLTVNGEVTVAENSQGIGIDRYTRKLSFSLRIRNFAGSGICFTKLTEFRYEVTDCDIRYERRSTEIADVRMSEKDFPVEKRLFASAYFDRLRRSFTYALNRNVVDGFNALFGRLDLTEYLRNQRMFENYENYVIHSTRSANEFVDGVMGAVRKTIKEKHRDSFAIPKIHEVFEKKGLVLTWRGSFTADHGTVRGLSTVARAGDTAFAIDNASRTHFFGSLSFEELNLRYDRCRVEFMNVGAIGTLNTRLRPIRLHIHPYVNFETGRIYLEDFQIDDVGELTVEVTGLGTALDWVTSKIATWTIGLTRDKVLDELQKKYEAYIKSVLRGYSIDDVTSGRAFGTA